MLNINRPRQSRTRLGAGLTALAVGLSGCAVPVITAPLASAQEVGQFPADKASLNLGVRFSGAEQRIPGFKLALFKAKASGKDENTFTEQSLVTTWDSQNDGTAYILFDRGQTYLLRQTFVAEGFDKKPDLVFRVPDVGNSAFLLQDGKWVDISTRDIFFEYEKKKEESQPEGEDSGVEENENPHEDQKAEEKPQAEAEDPGANEEEQPQADQETEEQPQGEEPIVEEQKDESADSSVEKPEANQEDSMPNSEAEQGNASDETKDEAKAGSSGSSASSLRWAGLFSAVGILFGIFALLKTFVGI